MAPSAGVVSMLCVFCPSRYRLSVAKEVGSEGSAARGGYSDPSEWPRSVCNAAALTARRTPGTATVRRTVNPQVVGSSPTRGAMKNDKFRQKLVVFQ